MHKPWTLDSIKKAIASNEKANNDIGEFLASRPYIKNRPVPAGWKVDSETATNVHVAADFAINQQIKVKSFQWWLVAIRDGISGMGKDHAMREFVTGMHKRGYVYHWDDDPADCLGGHYEVSATCCMIIRQIVKELYCEDMFTLAMQLREESEGTEVASEDEARKKIDPTSYGIHSCFCDIKDLATHGCKCGGC